MFLGSYVALCIEGRGEILREMNGVIQKCEVLASKVSDPISHATIKTESGNYIISSVPDCSEGVGVKVSVIRGLLYFNSVYVAEKR